MRSVRQVEVDPARAVGHRLPIVGGSRTYQFNEPLAAIVNGERVTGRAGWDPVLGWVLVAEGAFAPEPPAADDEASPGT